MSNNPIIKSPPLHGGPAWDALVELDLSRHREDIIEETRRASAKKQWGEQHREDPRYPDAKAREESAIATLVVKASVLADELEGTREDAAHGKKFRRGRPRRAKIELTKAVEWIRDNLKCFSLYAVLEVLEKREVVEKLFEKAKSTLLG